MQEWASPSRRSDAVTPSTSRAGFPRGSLRRASRRYRAPKPSFFLDVFIGGREASQEQRLIVQGTLDLLNNRTFKDKDHAHAGPALF
jgi:hypothetical protein